MLKSHRLSLSLVMWVSRNQFQLGSIFNDMSVNHKRSMIAFVKSEHVDFPPKSPVLYLPSAIVAITALWICKVKIRSANFSGIYSNMSPTIH